MPEAETRGRYDRSVVGLLITIFASACGTLIGTTALGKQVYDLTHEPINLGLLGLAEFAPAALLVLVTGSVADRYDRVRVSAVAEMVSGAAAAGLAIYSATRPSRVLPIFALVVLFGVGRAFYAPANRALPADVVSADVLPWLTARRSTAWQSAIIVGPVLGGFLYVIDPVVPYIAMAVMFVIAAAAMFMVTVPESAKAVTEEVVDVDPGAGHPQPVARGGLHEAVEGLRFIRRSPILLGAISLDLFAVLFGGAVALLPAIATDRLHVGAVGLGWLRAAGGIGAAATTIFIARKPVTRNVGRTLLIVVSIFGAFTIALGVTRIYAIAFLAMVVLNGADAVSVFIRSTLVPLITPFDKRGRVLAVESVFIGASNELGAFESGVAGQVLGSAGAIVLGGTATLVVAGLYWFAFPALRRVDRFPRANQNA